MIKFDKYSRKARVYPCLIVLLPIFLLSLIHITDIKDYYHYFTSATLLGVFFFSLAHIGRELGKKKENKLFKYWGGKPTTLILRHSDKSLNHHVKKNYHSRLQQILPDVTLPTKEEEEADIEAADYVYDRCCSHLISITRDTSKYHLLFCENTNYGFRRNLWGMKYLAIIIATFCIIIHVFISTNYFTFWESLKIIDCVLVVVLFFYIIFFVFLINKNCIKTPAFAYAERLYETLNEN